jgi:hypothetical protein
MDHQIKLLHNAVPRGIRRRSFSTQSSRGEEARRRCVDQQVILRLNVWLIASPLFASSRFSRAALVHFQERLLEIGAGSLALLFPIPQLASPALKAH